MKNRIHTNIHKIERKDNTDSGNPVFEFTTNDGVFQTAPDAQVALEVDESVKDEGAVISLEAGKIVNVDFDPNWETQETDLFVSNDEGTWNFVRGMELEELEEFILENSDQWGVDGNLVDVSYVYESLHDL